MALILRGKSRCAICGAVLKTGDSIVATTAFISDETDPLWRYSDAGMHSECFVRWEHREEFVRRFNATVGTKVWGSGMKHRMDESGQIIGESAE